jgi:septum site-determining protein MinD
VCENEELYFLPSSRNNDIFDFDTSELSNLLNELKNTFDYVIVECNNHKVSIKKLLPVSDMAIVVSCQDLLSVRNSDSVITMIEDEGVDIKLLINKFVSDETTTDYLMTPDDMIDRLGIKLIGVVPECDEFRKMINLSVFSLFENETVLKCVFENISKRIIGESIPLTDFNKKVKKSKFKVFSKK